MGIFHGRTVSFREGSKASHFFLIIKAAPSKIKASEMEGIPCGSSKNSWWKKKHTHTHRDIHTQRTLTEPNFLNSEDSLVSGRHSKNSQRLWGLKKKQVSTKNPRSIIMEVENGSLQYIFRSFRWFSTSMTMGKRVFCCVNGVGGFMSSLLGISVKIIYLYSFVLGW